MPAVATPPAAPRTKFSPPGMLLSTAKAHTLLRSARARVIVLSGVPGSGRTTALQTFVAGGQRPWAWCTLDPTDSEPARFLIDVCRALEYARPGPVPAAQSDKMLGLAPGQIEAALAALIDDLAAAQTPLVLVLDNYERIFPTSLVHDLVGLLADYLPTGCTLALSSRGYVPPRARGERWAERDVLELGPDDLALGSDEVAALLGLPADDPLVRRALALSDGWAAPLALVAREIEHGAERSAAVEMLAAPRGSLRAYLQAEVLDALSDELREFLLDAASIEILSAERCDRVRGATDSAALLEALHLQGLLRSAGEAYRLPAPLRAYLLALLEAAPARRDRLAWTHRVNDAVAQIAAACRQSEAPAAVAGLSSPSIAAWLADHHAAFHHDCELISLLGASLAQLAAADSAGAGSDGDSSPGSLALLLTRLAASKADAASRLIEALASDFPTDAARALILGAAAGLAHACGDWGRAAELVRAAEAAATASGQQRLTLHVLLHGSIPQALDRGEAERVVLLASQAVGLARAAGAQEALCRAQTLLSAGYLLLGDVAEAQRCADAALALARQLECPDAEADALRRLGAARRADPGANPDEALQCLRAAYVIMECAESRPSALHIDLACELSALLRQREELDEAGRLARQAFEWSVPLGPAGYARRGRSLVAMASVVYRSRVESALAALEEAERLFAATGDVSGRALTTFWRAVVAVTHDHPDSAARVSEALNACEHRLGQQLLAEEARTAVPMLVKALEHGVDSQRAASALARLGGPGFDALTELAASDNPALRLVAVQTLAHINNVRARRALSRGARDTDPAVRQAARAALESLGTPDAPMLRVYFLGKFRVERDGEVISDAEWKTRKDKLLLKYLVAYAGRPVQQEQLIELLWPDAEPRAAAMSLRTTLVHIRRALEPYLEGAASHFILHRNEAVMFNADAPHWVDSDEFLRHYRAGRQYEEEGQAQFAEAEYLAADALYRGDYLEEDPYEDWALADRERLRDVRTALVIRLAALRDAAGDIDRAIVYCQRAFLADPCREDVCRRLMELLQRAGRSGEALRVYNTCSSALRNELGVGPSAATRRLHRALLASLQGDEQAEQRAARR